MVRTRDDDILVVAHEVFENSKGSSFHVDITPVYPGVVRAESRTQEPIASLCHELSAAGLSSKAVTTLHILVDLLAKVLFNDGDFAVWLLGIFMCLDASQIIHQKLQSMIFRVGDEERKVDEVVRVCKVVQVREEHGQMRLGVTQGHTEQNSLLAFPSSSGSLHTVQVVVSYCLEVKVGAHGEEADRK